jgi:RNA polymerase-binding transcription factor DksA
MPPHKPHLVPEQLEALGAELLQTRARIEARLASFRRSWADIVDSAEGANVDDEHDPEGSTIAFEREQLSALIAQAERHLADLDGAAERLRDGTIGICVRCGGAISFDRLTARPAAVTCVRCAG